MPEEWITTAEAAEILKISARHVRELARQGKLKAKRDGTKWLIHRSLSEGNAEVAEVPAGDTSEAVRRLEDQIEYLKEQIQQKDKQIEKSQEQLVEKDKAIEEARQRSDTIILQLTRQLEQSQRLLEYHQEPFWRRWFKRKRRERETGDFS